MNLRKLKFDKLTYVGIRDIDEFEGQTIRENNIRCLDVPNVIDYIKKCEGPVHISFDVDALDPELVDSTGTCVPDGLEPGEVRDIISAALLENHSSFVALREKTNSIKEGMSSVTTGYLSQSPNILGERKI